ncbi:MAG: type IV pili methyl-accepting chemotaxis transducer N-terminal domain-containing protein, partial [Rubrivivax sp.]
MSLLDRIKGAGRAKPEADIPLPSAPFDELASPPGPNEVTVRLGQSTLAPGGRDGGDSSIISEAAPSELAPEFSETRLPGAEGEADGFTSGLPVIGTWALARQQRALIIMVGAGLAGILLTVLLVLLSSSSGSQQVAAAGQATTQSQRLAKSVSQALVGSAAAFPEVKESIDILASNVRSLKTGEGSVPAAPGALQEQLDQLVPLVDRAEKNAAIVLQQQKTLTQVGQALRAINRQSADLLETAETVSSLKLQGGASASELSAVGQLVMLTQRIGKSANEFLTTEGVSAEAVFLLGKDLNSFKEIAQGVVNGNADLRLPGTRDPQVREKLQQLLAQYEQTRTEASAILGNLQGLVAAREAQTAIVTDSEPLRRGLDTLQAGLAERTGFGGFRLVMGLLSSLVLVAGALGL